MKIKQITLLLLIVALMLTVIFTQNAEAAMKEQEVDYQISEWAKPEVDAARQLGFFTFGDVVDKDLTAPITRNEFRAVAMQFLRCQEQLDIYNNDGDMLTDAIKLQDGRFSQDGDEFFCTAVVLNDCGGISDGVPEYKAGNYQITVDIETLEVEKEWTPLSADSQS